MVSLVKNGILGSGIVAASEAITYHTGKVAVSPEYRYLVMKYEDISEVTPGWLFLLQAVTVKMRTSKEYQFAVFFSRKRLINTLKEMSVNP